MKITRYILLCQLTNYLYAQGHQDVAKYALCDVGNLLSSESRNLDSLINPFSLYDIREEKEKLDKSNFKKIIIIGCVHRPGIYICNTSITNKELLEKCGFIKYFNVHNGGPRSGRIVVYKKDNSIVQIGKVGEKNEQEFLEEKPENESHYNVMAYIL